MVRKGRTWPGRVSVFASSSLLEAFSLWWFLNLTRVIGSLEFGQAYQQDVRAAAVSTATSYHTIIMMYCCSILLVHTGMDTQFGRKCNGCGEVITLEDRVIQKSKPTIVKSTSWKEDSITIQL